MGYKGTALPLALVALTLGAAYAPLRAQTADYDATAKAQAAANAKPGVRHIPAHDVAVPTAEVSPTEQAIIGAPYSPIFNAHPKTTTEWKALVDRLATIGAQQIPALAKKLHVTVTPTTIAGVKCYIVQADNIPEKKHNRLLVHVHGGGYVLGPGLAAAREAMLLAGFGGFKVISIDYRMPPDFPYPAAMDDAMAVWKEAVKMADPKNMAIFGTSTGGGMTLAMVLRAKDEHLPLPAAIAPGTPWADLTDTGDSYKINEWADNILVTWNGWLGDAAKLYAGGHDL
jgi:acetyl esterase/lipase